MFHPPPAHYRPLRSKENNVSLLESKLQRSKEEIIVYPKAKRKSKSRESKSINLNI